MESGVNNLNQFVEEVKRVTSLSTKELAEKLGVTVAMMKEIEKGFFPHPVFAGLLISALSGLCCEKYLEEMSKLLDERKEIERNFMGVSGTFERIDGKFFVKPLPKDD